MADEVGSWSTEEVPDEDNLWMRVHKNNMDNGELRPGAFRNLPNKKTDGMSTDWAKYATAQETRDRASVPQDNAVIRLNVGEVRKIRDQTVVHTPDIARRNRAHTDVYGEKHPQARLLLNRTATIVISL